MMQFETSFPYALASQGALGGSSATSSEGGAMHGSVPRKGSLSVLVDGDMTRLGEFLDGCPGVSTTFFDRSRHSSFAESSGEHHQQHQQQQQQDQQRRAQPQHYQQQQQYQYQQQQPQHQDEHSPSFDPPSDATRSAETGALGGSDWNCPALVDDGAMIPYPPDTSNSVSFASDYTRSVPYFGVPCWMAGEQDHGADGSSPSIAPLPLDSSPASHDGCGDFGHFAMDALEHGKDASSPAHMEHFMPFVHHGEPEMIFAGMDLSHAEFQGLHFSHLPQHQHQSHFFPGSVQQAHNSGSDVDQFAPQHQQHSAMLQLDSTDPHGSSMELHGAATMQADDGLHSSWSAGFLAPTHFITSESRKHHSQYVESTAVKPKTRTSHATKSSPSTGGNAPRVLRGRFSGTQWPPAPQQPSPAPAVPNGTAKSPSASHFHAELRLVTALNDCYWKNGRKNLQCFPACPEHNDFYSMKMNNRKHSSVGVCRGPVYCHVIAKAAWPAMHAPSSPSLRKSHRVAASNANSDCGASLQPSIPSSSQQMKYEHGVGASGSGGSSQELFVLGRFERVPQRDNTDLVDELSAPPEFSSSVAFEEFRYGCFQAIEMKERRTRLAATDRENLPHEHVNVSSSSVSNGTACASGDVDNESGSEAMVRSTWFFLPDVWKVQPMLKKKRKATRSAPAQTFPFCFRVFVYTAHESVAGGYTCVSSTVSTFFELYSTRTVDRVKRKYWSKSSDAALAGTKRQARG